MEPDVAMTEEQWRERLDPERYAILREKATEPPFTGAYVHNKAEGVYRCGACNSVLFSSETKYDSGSGWPSFTDPASEANVTLEPDHSHGMVRTEVLCGTCGSHLGHLFDDGPGPSGQRYCINSAALDFEATEASSDA
jgi:peptide-methionine (R)-S-oxide reductase